MCLNAKIKYVVDGIKMILLILFTHHLYVSEYLVGNTVPEFLYIATIPVPWISYSALLLLCGLCFLTDGFLPFMPHKQRYGLLVVWFMYCIGIAWSDVVTGETISNIISPILAGILYFVIFPRLKISFSCFCIALTINALWLIVNSLLFRDIQFHLYNGIYWNSNSFGIMVFGSAVGVLYLAVCQQEKYKFIYSTILALFALFVIWSGSRSSLFSMGIMLIGFLGGLHFDTFNFRWRIKKFTVIIGIFFLGIILCIVVQYGSDIFEFLNSLVFKWGSSRDLNASRMMRWTAALSDLSWFGHGNSPFLGVHNNFIWLLYSYGGVAVIFFCIFYFSAMCYSLADFKRCKNKNSIYAFWVILSACVALSFEEGLGLIFGYPINFLCFLVIGKMIFLKPNACKSIGVS